MNGYLVIDDTWGCQLPIGLYATQEEAESHLGDELPPAMRKLIQNPDQHEYEQQGGSIIIQIRDGVPIGSPKPTASEIARLEAEAEAERKAKAAERFDGALSALEKTASHQRSVTRRGGL